MVARVIASLCDLAAIYAPGFAGSVAGHSGVDSHDWHRVSIGPSPDPQSDAVFVHGVETPLSEARAVKEGHLLTCDSGAAAAGGGSD